MTKNNNSSLSSKDIKSCLPVSQRPFQYAIQSNIKIGKDKYNDAAIILSKHYIFILDSKNSSHKKKLKIFDIHICDIDKIEKKADKYVYIGNSQGTLSIIIYNIDKSVMKFSQLLYRNIILSYYNNCNIEIKWDDNSNFPPIDIRYISPSQAFQFNYLAYCTQNKKKYNHNFVRYIHNLIIEDSPIIDLSILTPKYFQKRINSLKCAQNIYRGICLKDFSYPDVIKAFSQLIVDNSNIKIVSFTNCNCTQGLSALADAILKATKKKKSFGVSYWDLSYNKFSNFSNFSVIIENSTKPIKYLNINGCNICDEDTKILFSSLENFEHVKKLKFLSIAGAQFNSNKSLHAFKHFLQVCGLTYLDLSYIDDVADVISTIEKVGIRTLRTLILNNTLLETRSLDDLLSIIKDSENLSELDISGTGLRVESISSIIETINNNGNLKHFILKLNSLELHGNSLKSVIKSFLGEESGDDGNNSPRSKKRTSQMKKSSKKTLIKKWRSLSFASNEMVSDDLNRLIKLFKQMKNLEMVYLDDNFDSSMEKIGELLCDLLNLENPLLGISLAGSKKHKLQDELIVFLKEAAKSDILEYLNIENNDLENGAIQSIKNLLINSKSLKTLKIDHNSFSSVSKIKSIVDAVEVCQTLTTFGFPIFDSVQLCANDDEGKMEESLLHLQSRANFIISQHRREKMAESIRQNGSSDDIIYEQLKCQVPFDVENEDVERLLASLINKYPKVLPNKRNYHSFACELFNLPFPFQQEDELPTDCKLDILRQENSDYLKVYDKTESLLDYIKELPRQFSYQDKQNRVSYLPTYGPTIERILDDDYLKKPKKFQSMDQSDYYKRKSAVKFPSDINIKGSNLNNQFIDKVDGDLPLKTRVVDSRKLDDLVDTRLNDENPRKSKRKSSKNTKSQKKSRIYDNESIFREEEQVQNRQQLYFDNGGRSIFDESSDQESNPNNNQRNKKPQKSPSSKSKLKLRAEDDSYSNSEEDNSDDEIRNQPRKGNRKSSLSRNQGSEHDYSSDPPINNKNRRRVLDNDSESNDTDENVRRSWKKSNPQQSQVGNYISGSSSTSEDDDANTPFMQQRPISKVIPVSTDSYIINRNKNNNEGDEYDEFSDNYNKSRNVNQKRNRKSSAYDPSISTDNSLQNSDDNIDDENDQFQEKPQYNDIDMFNVSPMPKPPHLKSPQDALAFAYDLMIADQSEEQINNDDDNSDN